jgi:hypothetical protein
MTSSQLNTLQPYFMEFITEKLIKDFEETLLSSPPKTIEKSSILNTHPVIQSLAKENIRKRQVKYILKTILKDLYKKYKSSQQIENNLKLIVQDLQRSKISGYAGGNIINLIIQLKLDEQNSISTELEDYDFSNLFLWEVYLKNINLYNVNLSESEFKNLVFTEPRSTALSIAFSQNGNFFAMGDGNSDIYILEINTDQTVRLPKKHSSWHWSFNS